MCARVCIHVYGSRDHGSFEREQEVGRGKVHSGGGGSSEGPGLGVRPSLTVPKLQGGVIKIEGNRGLF